MKLPIYLDHNATTPCDQKVLEAMLPYFTACYGNAASKHHPYGWLAEEAVDASREDLASLIGASPKEIVFTSGATEAINLAIRGVLLSRENQRKHLVTVATEHAAVLDTCKDMERLGFTTTYLPVQSNGLIDLKDLELALCHDTALVSVMVANNETGVIQPIRQIAEITHGHGALLMADAVQAAGKIPLDIGDLGVDLMPLSAHKMYGPKGVGALFVRKVNLQAEITGGGHERGRRSGTLNVSGIVGFGKATQLALLQREEDYRQLKALRDKLEKEVLELPGTYLNGGTAPRLPHVSNISFEGVDSKEWLIAVNKAIAVSSGSACSSVTERASHVLRAMGVSEELGKASIRFSLGRSTTEDDIDFAIHHISLTLQTLRNKK